MVSTCQRPSPAIGLGGGQSSPGNTSAGTPFGSGAIGGSDPDASGFADLFAEELPGAASSFLDDDVELKVSGWLCASSDCRGRFHRIVARVKHRTIATTPPLINNCCFRRSFPVTFPLVLA